MERKRRTYMHKGKLRFKGRLPRKQKKAQKKKWDAYKERLIEIYGEDKWIEHVVFGG